MVPPVAGADLREVSTASLRVALLLVAPASLRAAGVSLLVRVAMVPSGLLAAVVVVALTLALSGTALLNRVAEASRDPAVTLVRLLSVATLVCRALPSFRSSGCE